MESLGGAGLDITQRLPACIAEQAKRHSWIAPGVPYANLQIKC